MACLLTKATLRSVGSATKHNMLQWCATALQKPSNFSLRLRVQCLHIPLQDASTPSTVLGILKASLFLKQTCKLQSVANLPRAREAGVND